ncbi:RRP12-like protein [Channa argus]|uniref:RRP12-like protein n=1 Tax=Channa argus TaxID=215402 RepID=A0A6G1R0I7_CHAAH|nr:RRP12-like protein [Channa argus]
MVKSGKLRSGTGSKLKRWKKGHSSDSNPQTSRFRQAAKSRFFSRPTGKSDLTVDALKLHNELQAGPLELGASGHKDNCMEDEPDETVSERTSGTFLSGLSDCSNLTFRKVQRFWESNSAAHKEICAVLAAVTEVIRSQGGKETETEYFAALMTTLEVVDSAESQAAVAYLLNLVMKRVPAPVLVSKFSDTTKALMDVMSKQATSETASALRWILSCLATLLRKQDVSIWNYPSTLQAYHGLLSFTVHCKPKVRKAAQQGVCSILRGSDFLFTDNAPSHHPAALTTAKFCIKEIEQAGGSKEDTTTLHILGLLKELMGTFPLGAVKSCCETLLRVMTLSHVLVTASAMQAFHRLFSGKANTSTLSPELNAQIITALYDYLPSENDLQPMLAWLAVMEKAHVHLASLQSSLSLGHLPRLFSAAMSCLLSPHTQVVSAATNTLKTLLTECVAPHMEEMGMISATASAGNPSYVCKMFRIVEEGLSYRFHTSWPFVLQILGCFYRIAGKQAHPIMTKSLQSLADLRSTPQFPFSGELDLAVGGAVESMGPEVVVGAVSLNITGYDDDLEFPRSWLIPVIRDHVKNTRLAFFASYFLPLASTLRQRAEELEQAGQKLEAKVYQTLQLQIWTMFPGFCTCPVDLLASFKGIARTLGMAINERPDLRLIVCQALRTIINKSCSTEEEKADIGRFSKNFLPILFNVYSQQPAAGESGTYRMAVLDTIKVYLTVTEKQMICTFLQKATDRLNSTDTTEFTRLAMMDLVVAMAPFVDEVTMTETLQLIRPYLENNEPGMQKKAYRVLEEMCGGESDECKAFVVANIETLKAVLLETLKNASSPAKRPRLKCLHHIVKRLNEEHKDFIIALLPEVIICTKEVSVGARKNAYNLLVEIGKTFVHFFGNTKGNKYLPSIYLQAFFTVSILAVDCGTKMKTRLLGEMKDILEEAGVKSLKYKETVVLSKRNRSPFKILNGFINMAEFKFGPSVELSHLWLIQDLASSINVTDRLFVSVLLNYMLVLPRIFMFLLLKILQPEWGHCVFVYVRKTEAQNTPSIAVHITPLHGSDLTALPSKLCFQTGEKSLLSFMSDMVSDKNLCSHRDESFHLGKKMIKPCLQEHSLNLHTHLVSRLLMSLNHVKQNVNLERPSFMLTCRVRSIFTRGAAAERFPVSIDLCDGRVNDFIKSFQPPDRSTQNSSASLLFTGRQVRLKSPGSPQRKVLCNRPSLTGEITKKWSRADLGKILKLQRTTYITVKVASICWTQRCQNSLHVFSMVRNVFPLALSWILIQKTKTADE